MGDYLLIYMYTQIKSYTICRKFYIVFYIVFLFLLLLLFIYCLFYFSFFPNVTNLKMIGSGFNPTIYGKSHFSWLGKVPVLMLLFMSAAIKGDNVQDAKV